MLRILLTDFMFPNKYAKWRLVEIKAFINKYDTDILICKRIPYFQQIVFNFDYEELKESHSLETYDILIFNPEFNYLNKYNEDFDGTKFNKILPFDYLLRLKKYRKDNTIDLNDYSYVYHIFILCYTWFNEKVKYSYERQFIHLYPGGGLINMFSLTEINPNVKLIVAQRFITEYMKKLNINNNYIEVFCGPYLDQGETIHSKSKKLDTLNVCFTSIGIAEDKGAHIYAKIIKLYKETHKEDDVKFYYAGLDYKIPDATYLGLLSQSDLDKIYTDKIDILFNLDIGKSLNGFPLGVEGMIRGVILFTTDNYKSNKKNNYGFTSELRIVKINNIPRIVKKIRKLYKDRDLLLSDSKKIQEKSIQLFNYDNTMKKIFNFIENFNPA